VNIKIKRSAYRKVWIGMRISVTDLVTVKIRLMGGMLMPRIYSSIDKIGAELKRSGH